MKTPTTPADGQSEVMAGATPRFQRAERRQIEWLPRSLDQLLPADHTARLVWAYVESLDLSPLYAKIRAVEGHVGRDPIDPRILLALWLFATIDAVGSARRLGRLCEEQISYQWFCGGVTVNHHTLSDFRVAHVEFLDELLTQSVATLLHQVADPPWRGLIELTRLAQDGMRVRASAGSSSFRRQETLEQCLDRAETRLKELREEAERDDSSENRRVKAARERAARERLERVQAALDEREKVAAAMDRRKKESGKDARASTTDPEARRMKMADGGFRPAYNVQFATTTDTLVITGVDVVNSGGDGGQMQPMIEQVEGRYGTRPKEHLADGGFSTKKDIEALEAAKIKVYAPVKEEEKKQAKGIDPFARLPSDSDELGDWRERMGTAEAKEIYRQRAPTAEFPNAGCRNRGLRSFMVRGLGKVKAVALWQALAHNFQRALKLHAAAELVPS